MPESNELDELEAGLMSPFWQRVLTNARNEWGPAGERFQQAVRMAAAKAEDDAVHTLKCVLFAQEEIRKLLEWPKERVRELRHIGDAQASVDPQSRRGIGL